MRVGRTRVGQGRLDRKEEREGTPLKTSWSRAGVQLGCPGFAKPVPQAVGPWGATKTRKIKIYHFISFLNLSLCYIEQFVYKYWRTGYCNLITRSIFGFLLINAFVTITTTVIIYLERYVFRINNKKRRIIIKKPRRYSIKKSNNTHNKLILLVKISVTVNCVSILLHDYNTDRPCT